MSCSTYNIYYSKFNILKESILLYTNKINHPQLTEIVGIFNNEIDCSVLNANENEVNNLLLYIKSVDVKLYNEKINQIMKNDILKLIISKFIKCKKHFIEINQHYIIQYIEEDNLSNKDLIDKDYKNQIISKDINNELTYIYDHILALLKSINVHTNFLESEYNKHKSLFYTQTNDLKTCQNCKSEYNIDTSQSALVCDICNDYKPLYGVILDDTSIVISDGTLIKKTSYKPHIHCVNHINNLQGAKLPKQFDDYNDQFKQWFNKKRIDLKTLTNEDVRDCLSHFKCTKFNKYIPSIIRYYSGNDATILESEEINEICNIFDQCINIINDNTDKKANIRYYPYFIFKIIEHMLYGKDDERLKKIANLNHFQSEDTIAKNDVEWKKICKSLNMKYIETDFHYYKKKD